MTPLDHPPYRRQKRNKTRLICPDKHTKGDAPIRWRKIAPLWSEVRIVYPPDCLDRFTSRADIFAREIVEWILANISDPYNNARWRTRPLEAIPFGEIDECNSNVVGFYAKFRHPADAMLFAIKWK